MSFFVEVDRRKTKLGKVTFCDICKRGTFGRTYFKIYDWKTVINPYLDGFSF